MSDQDLPEYPDGPGYRRQIDGGTTSRDAAKLVAPGAKGMAADVLAILKEHGAKCPEEITEIFARAGRRVLLTSVRARCTQLLRLGKIEDSGERGVGESGKSKVIRWRVVAEQPPEAQAA